MFRYRWSLRRHWLSWLLIDFKRFYYSKFHGFNMDYHDGTAVPNTGKGRHVSVYTKGQIIQIVHESGYDHLEFDEIRIIPCQYNHGVFVERFSKGVMRDRHVLTLNQLNGNLMFASNVEQLAGRKKPSSDFGTKKDR